MYNFTDLIARSYLKYVNKGTKEVNIAQTFFQEYNLVSPDAKAKYIFSHKQFYTELINEIDNLTKRAVHNHHLNSLDFEINDAEDFEEFQKKRLLDHQALIDDFGVTYAITRVNYEECNNAKQLLEALQYGLNLIDPIKIISPNKEIQADDLVLRKSKLEYLKTEAIRARDAHCINDLDSSGLLPNMSSNNVSVHNFNDSQPKREEVLEEFVFKALEIIKPLGGIYILDSLLEDADMKRLNEYVAILIKTGNLPVNTLPFPKLEVKIPFIRKTIHLVYILIGKKFNKEFIQLIHLFENFNKTQQTTTISKFAEDDKTYDDKIKDISYKSKKNEI